MWAYGAKLEGTCGSTIKSTDWKESSDGSGGWLATGCSAGTVGISWIGYPSHEDCYATPSEGEDSLCKSHFILRGHTGEVDIVRWMPSGVRLASYDSWGCIILWNNHACALALQFKIKPMVVVTDLQWSPCGSYLITCAESGNIALYSSSTGTIVFSMYVGCSYSLVKRAKFTCCSWNQPGTRIAFGTYNAKVVFLDPVSRAFTINGIDDSLPVQCIDWYRPTMQCRGKDDTVSPVLCQCVSVYLRNGTVVFNQIPDRDVRICTTGIVDGGAAWSSNKSVFVVIGRKDLSCVFLPVAYFFNCEGDVIFTISQDLPQFEFPVRNVLWALQDSVVIFTCGPHIYTLKVDHSLPTLESLCQHTIMSKIISEGDVSVEFLPLPKHVVSQLSRLKLAVSTEEQFTSEAD